MALQFTRIAPHDQKLLQQFINDKINKSNRTLYGQVTASSK